MLNTLPPSISGHTSPLNHIAAAHIFNRPQHHVTQSASLGNRYGSFYPQRSNQRINQRVGYPMHTTLRQAADGGARRRSLIQLCAHREGTEADSDNIKPTRSTNGLWTLQSDHVAQALQRFKSEQKTITYSEHELFSAFKNDERNLYMKSDEQKIIFFDSKSRADLLHIIDAFNSLVKSYQQEAASIPTLATVGSGISSNTLDNTIHSEFQLVDDGVRLSDIRQSIQQHYNIKIPDACWSWFSSELPQKIGRLKGAHCIFLNTLIDKTIEHQIISVLTRPELDSILPFYHWAVACNEEHIVSHNDLTSIRLAYLEIATQLYIRSSNINYIDQNRADQNILISDSSLDRFKFRALLHLGNRNSSKDDNQSSRQYQEMEVPSFLIKTTINQPFQQWLDDNLSQLTILHNPNRSIHLMNSLGPDNINIGIKSNDLPLLYLEKGSSRTDIREFLEKLTGRYYSTVSANQIHQAAYLGFGKEMTESVAIVSLSNLKRNSIQDFFQKILSNGDLMNVVRIRSALQNGAMTTRTATAPSPSSLAPTDPEAYTRIAPLLTFFANLHYVEAMVRVFKESGSPAILLEYNDLEEQSKRVFDHLDHLLTVPPISRGAILQKILFNETVNESGIG